MAQKRILLVDDAEETRNFLAESVLAPEGYEMLTAANAKEALAILQTTNPDLIISDFLMPEITGLELLQRLKTDNRNIPFILITAEGSESLAVKALRLGVRDYFIKPFDIDDLLMAINRVLLNTTAPQELTAKLDYLLWHVDDIIIITDKEQKLTFYNEAANIFFDKKTGSIHGLPLSEITSHLELLALFSDEKIQPYLQRCEIMLDTNHIYSVHLTSIPHEGFVAIMQDITYSKEQEKEKADFATNLSQNLRSPLTAIQGYAELLGRAGNLNETQQKYIQHIVQNVKATSDLISHIFELNKIEAESDLTLEYIPIETIVKYAVESVQSELAARGHHLTSEFAPLLPRVIGNPIRLKQMVIQLLQNSIKYTPDNGKIHVKLYSDDKLVILQVKDSGIGIPTAAHTSIWEKFFRTREAENDYPGTGLGLSIVKNIVDAHNGRIWVNSVPHEGTTFTVMLPGSKPKYE